MKINLLQLNVAKTPEQTIKKVSEITKEFSDEIFILPELFTTGFVYEHIKKHVHAQNNLLLNLPKANTYIGSVVRPENGKIYNSFFVKYGDSIEYLYDKIHLFPLMDEDKQFARGEKPSTFDLRGFKCGCAICFDLRFPELFRKYFHQDVELVIIPMQWPLSRISQMLPIATARAIENQCYVAICNAVGDIWGVEFGGHSVVISPYGEILADAFIEKDSIIKADIDKEDIISFKKSMPIKNCIRL